MTNDNAEKENDPEQKTQRQRCIYTEQDRTALVNYLIDALEAGLHADNNFKPVVWTKAAKHLNNCCTHGARKTPSSCKQQYSSLVKTFRIVKELRDKSGFGWDDKLKKPTATAKVWNDLASNKKYLPMSKPGFHFALYDDLERLTGGKTATGKDALSISTILNSTQSSIRQTDSQMVGSQAEEEEIAETQATGISFLDSTEFDDEEVPQSQTSDTPPASQKGRKRAATPEPDSEQQPKKKRNSRPSAPAAITDMADAIRQLGSSVDPQTPKRLTEAIKRAHHDLNLTTEERARLMKLFTDKMAVADAYLAFDDDMTDSRTEFVRLSIG